VRRLCKLAVSQILGMMLIFILTGFTAFAAQGASGELKEVPVYVDGYPVPLTESAVVVDGSTLVQLRPIFETIGAEVLWNEETGMITGKKGIRTVELTIGSMEAKVNGETTALSVSPQIINGSTMVPARFVGESLRCKVDWDEITGRVDIVTDGGYYVDRAIAADDMVLLKQRLEEGATVNFTNRTDGMTVLGRALTGGRLDMTALLLQYGADPDRPFLAANGVKQAPLEWAITERNPELVKLLLDYGADAAGVPEAKAIDLARKLQQQAADTGEEQKLEEIIGIVQTKEQENARKLSSTDVLVPYNAGGDSNYQNGDIGLWGFLDKSGRTAILPRYATVGLFSEGLAYAVTKDGSRSGYIDQTGRFHFELDTEMPRLVYYDFKEGLAAVELNGKWGYVDSSGQLAIPYIYDWATPFSEGLAWIKTGDNWGFINKQGEVIVEPQYKAVLSFQEGVALVSGEQYVGYIDTTGGFAINLDAICAGGFGSFSEGYAPVLWNERVGFIDRTGNMVIPPVYETASEFHEGLAVVRINGKYGFIDRQGQEVIKPQYEGAYFFHNDRAMVKADGKWGFINRNNQFIVKPQYEAYDSILKGSYQHIFYRPMQEYPQRMATLYKDRKKSYLLPDWTILE
jgi:hypothetical protein